MRVHDALSLQQSKTSEHGATMRPMVLQRSEKWIIVMPQMLPIIKLGRSTLETARAYDQRLADYLSSGDARLLDHMRRHEDGDTDPRDVWR